MNIHVYLSDIIKELLDRKFYHQHYSVQLKVNDFFKAFIHYALQDLKNNYSDLLIPLLRLLKNRKKFYDSRYSDIPLDIESKYQETDESQENFDLITIQENDCLKVFFVYNVKYFASEQGFAKIIQLTNEISSFLIITRIVNFISNFQNFMERNYWKTIAKNLTKVLTSKVQNLTDEEIRVLHRQDLKKFFISFEGLLQRLYHLGKASEILENTELELSIRFLTSKYLEKRIFGIGDIIGKVTQAKIKEKMCYQSGLDSKWMNVENLLAWIDTHDLIGIIFGPSSHPEIVKRSAELVKFLYVHSRFTSSHIDKLWDCALLKHETDRDAMISLISELVYELKLNDLQSMYTKIHNLDLHDIDVQILGLLKSMAFQFSKSQIRSDNDSEKIDLEDTWKDYEETKEKYFIPSQDPISCSDVLEFIWKLCQEESLTSGITFSVAAQALEILKDSLVYYHQNDKYKFLCKCIENLKKNSSVVTSCKLLEEIISSYSDIRSNYETESRSSVIKTLEKEQHLFNEIFSSLLLFKKEAVERAQVFMVGPHDKLEDSREENCFTCSSDDDSQASEERGLKHSEVFKKIRISADCDLNYFEELRFRLNFLKFLYLNSAETLQLKHAHILWETLIINAVTEEEHESVFSWLASSLNTWYNEGVIVNEELTHYIFTDFILKLDPRFYSLGGYHCFEKYFISLNKQHGIITSDFDGDFEVKETPILGLQYLWEILLQARNKKVFKNSKYFMKKIYQGLRQPHEEVMQELIRNCMGFISEGSERQKNTMDIDALNQIYRSLCVLIDFLQDFESMAQHESLEITVKNHIADTFPKDFFVTATSNMSLHSLKLLISTRISPRLAVSELIIFHNNKSLPSKNDSSSLAELGFSKGSTVILFEANMDFENSEELHNENLAQLRSIFTGHSDEVLALVLESVQNNLDEAVNTMFNEELVLEFQKRAESRSHKNKPQPLQSLSEIISNSQEYFSLLFQLFDIGDEKISSKVWELLVKIPVNQAIYLSIIELNESACFSILSMNCVHKLLYGLKIVNSILAQNSADTATWKLLFMEKGFLTHIYTTLMSSQNFELTGNNKSSCLCVELLIKIIKVFVQDVVDPKEFCPSSAEVFIEEINFSALMVKMLDVIEQSINKELQGTSLIESALDLMIPLIVHNAELLSKLYSQVSFYSLINYLLDSQNPSVRKAIKFTIESIVEAVPLPPNNLEHPTSFFKKAMLKHLPEPEMQNCDEYFEMLVKLFKYSSECQENILAVCIDFISRHKPNEDKRLGNQNKVLTGYLNLAAVLVNDDNYADLVKDLYKSLFEISIEAPPKFKHELTRKAAFGLLVSLTRKNKENQTAFLALLSQNSYLSLGSLDSEILARSIVGYVGLRNFGATCYMNSLIQQLFMIKPFREGIQQACIAVEDPDDSLDDNLLYQLQNLFWNLEESDKKYFEPIGFCRAFKDYEGNPMNVKIQQDVDEFFIILCDKIEELLKPTLFRTLLNSCFGGRLVHEIQSCEESFPYKGETEEQFYRISLDIKNKKTLSEALDLYIKEDLLDGDNKYYYELHNCKIAAKKRCLLSKLSNTILIHLKRFEFNYSTMQRTKMNEYCEFPMKLDLKPWSTQVETDENYYNYELTGVLVHSGYADAGHYYSIIKDRQTGIWIKFDDKHVEVFDMQNLKEVCFGGERADNWPGESFAKTKNAYMLVYERTTSLPITTQILQKTETFLIDSSHEIRKKITKENHVFLHDKLYFDKDYSDFLEKFYDNYEVAEVKTIEKNASVTDEIAELAMLNSLFSEDKTLEKSTYTELYSVPQVIHAHELLKISRNGKEYEQDLNLLKACTLFALEMLLRGKQGHIFVKWVQKLLENYHKHLPSCLWLLQYLTENRKILSEILLENNESDVRNELKNLLCEVLLVVSRSEAEYLEEEISTIRTKALPYIEEEYNRYSLYKKYWVSSTTRFLKMYLGYLFHPAINSPKTYSEYLNLIRNISNDPGMMKLLIFFNAISKIYQSFIGEFTTSLQTAVISLDNEVLIELASTLILKCKTSNMILKNSYPKGFLYNDQGVILSNIEENSLITGKSIERLVSLAKYRDCRNVLLHLAWENEKVSIDALEKICSGLFDFKFDQNRYQSILKLGYFLLSLSDSLRFQRVDCFLTLSVYKMSFSSNSNTFFDVLSRTKITNNMFFVSVLIWWNDLLKYDHVLAVTQQHSNKLYNAIKDGIECRYSSNTNFWDYMENMRPLQQEISKAFTNLTQITKPEEVEPEIIDVAQSHLDLSDSYDSTYSENSD